MDKRDHIKEHVGIMCGTTVRESKRGPKNQLVPDLFLPFVMSTFLNSLCMYFFSPPRDDEEDDDDEDEESMEEESPVKVRTF